MEFIKRMEQFSLKTLGKGNLNLQVVSRPEEGLSPGGSDEFADGQAVPEIENFPLPVTRLDKAAESLLDCFGLIEPFKNDESHAIGGLHHFQDASAHWELVVGKYVDFIIAQVINGVGGPEVCVSLVKTVFFQAACDYLSRVNERKAFQFSHKETTLDKDPGY